MDEPRKKQVILRLTQEDYFLIQFEACRTGHNMGPMIRRWIDAKLKRIKTSHGAKLARVLNTLPAESS